MKVYLASDHAGYWLKEDIKNDIASWGWDVVDLGNHKFDPDDDYPDFIIPAAEKVADDKDSLGVIFGRSGQGEAICANKVKGVRAAVCFTEDMASLARSHNSANILSLGSDFVEAHRAEKIVKTFLDTPFSEDERHIRRLGKIDDYEAYRD
jgi:ribose 5-phosphate isomerase B